MSITPVTPIRATYASASPYQSPAPRLFFPSSPQQSPPPAPLKGRVCPGKPVKASAEKGPAASPAAVAYDPSWDEPLPKADFSSLATPSPAAIADAASDDVAPIAIDFSSAASPSAAVVVADDADDSLPDGIDFSSLAAPSAAAVEAHDGDDALPDGVDFSSLANGVAAPQAAVQPNHLALIDLHLALLNGSSLDGFTLKPLAHGSFMQVFSTNEDPSFVIKVFLESHLKRNPANANHLYNLLTHAIGQYLLCERCGIPTATIMNDPTADYLIQMEFVPGTLKDDLASWAHPEGSQTPPKRVTELPEAVQNRLAQIVSIVAKGAEATSEGLYIDADPSNFGVRADGRVVLIDHREERLDMGENVLKDFAGELRTAVNKLSKGNPHIRAHFLNAIRASAPTIHQHILEIDLM